MSTSEFHPAVYSFDFQGNQIDALFSRISRLPGMLFLDGGGNSNGPLNRYSYLAADPIEQLVVQNDDPFCFDQIRHLWKKYSSLSCELPPFQGGLAGYLAYELNTKLEQINSAAIDDFSTPLLVMNVYDVVVALDNAQGQGWIISQGWSKADDKDREQKAQQRLEEFKQLLFDSAPIDEPSWQPTNSTVPDSQMNRVDAEQDLFSDFSRDEFLNVITQAVDYIHRGDIFQTNLSQRLLTSASRSPHELYLTMRQKNPAPFSCFFDFGDGHIISASPERLVSLNDGQIETRPIKGTRKRTGYPEADLNVSQELAASEKDRAENVMIVDLMRNDLSKVAQPDSVLVQKLCGIEQFQKVVHLVSVISAELRDDCDCVDLLQAVFPGGSITGAPKIRAMEIISELEPTVRGPYCGSLGYISHDGNMDFNILIRTITAKDGWWQIPVGGGIVSDSNPELEYEETWTKAIGMLAATTLETVNQKR